MLFRFLSVALAAFFFTACQKPAEDESSSGGSGSSSSSKEAVTDCGVVFGGKTSNPVNLSDGEQVRIRDVMGTNLLVIESTDPASSGPVLLKLHGVSSGPSNRSAAAKNLIRSMAGSRAAFFKASKDCNVTLQGGGQGTIGHLISANGESINEALIKSGLADVDANDACGGDQIGGCLNALKGSEIEPAGQVSDFLWKPQSDTRAGMVIHEDHCNTIVLVNGEEFSYAGAANGRCGTFRSPRGGCAYGNNVKVQVLDKTTGRPYTHNGKPYVIVPNGCQRFEFK